MIYMCVYIYDEEMVWGSFLQPTHGWEKGDELAADSFIQALSRRAFFCLYCDCVNDAGDNFPPLFFCAWTEGSSFVLFLSFINLILTYLYAINFSTLLW